MHKICIIDCGIGNLRSVQRAFERVGENAQITGDPENLKNASSFVLPGVGAFPDAMKNLKRKGLDLIITQNVIEKKKPILGICLGMQLLAQNSCENGLHTGLGIVPGKVVLLEVKGQKNWLGHKLTLPHVGWNQVKSRKKLKLFKNIPDNSDFYFVHSFHFQCKTTDYIAATTTHGISFISALEHENVFATQFHPEKSQRLGHQLIKNFVNYCYGDHQN